MIASLKGTVSYKDHEGAIIECAGVGYGVAASTQTLLSLGAVGEPAQVFVYTHVAEDALKLYAFFTADERRAFEALLAAQGVGPRLALAILSTLTPEHLIRAVTMKDKTALTAIPGVGPKKAERLLLDLAGRLNATSLPLFADKPPSTRAADDVASALVHLGFVATEAQNAAQAAQAAAPQEKDVTALIRLALQRLSQKR